jgi:hypothetical protein
MAGMQYTLITAKGKVFTFFLSTLAETYQSAYGGVIISNDIDQETTVGVV